MLTFNLQSRCSSRARRPIATAAAIVAACVVAAGLYACGGGSSGTSSSSSSSGTDFQAVFTDGIRALTPNVATSAVNEWDGWSAYAPEGIHQYSVLNKLFNPNSGWESVFGPVEATESVLELLEAHDDILAENGTHEISENGLTFTVVVSDYSGDFTVPYFESTQSGLTKKVVITASDDSYSMMAVYDMDGDDKAMVVHSRLVSESNEFMVFRATFNETSQDLQIWSAAANDSEDSFKISFIWKGNLADGTFALTQYTNAAKEDNDSDGIFETDGFWKVMGGGSIDTQMSFRAVTNDSPTDDYFVVVTLDDIIAATPPMGYPAEASTIDAATTPAQSYVDTADPDCLGWLTAFPEAADLSWSY